MAVILTFPAPQMVTTGASMGMAAAASASGSPAFKASYASTCMLPGIAHSARSSALRMSNTVTGWRSASIARSSSTSMMGLGRWCVMVLPLLLLDPSKDQHVGRLGTATGEVGRRGEGGVFALEIGLQDPTGLRAAPSDKDRDTLLLNLCHQLPQRR